MDTPRLNYSTAKILLAQSPHHAWLAHPLLNPNYEEKHKAEFDLGTAAHDLLLEGGTAKVCVIEPELYRSKPTKDNPEGNIPKGWTNDAIRAARDEAYTNKLTPVLPWEYAGVKQMVEAARAFIAKSELKGIFEQGKCEQELQWNDDGIACRGRADFITDDRSIILDYKTTNDANPEAFIRQISRMQYDLQAAFYCNGVAFEGYPINNPLFEKPRFVFLVQETAAPYACSLVALSNAWIEIAQERYRKALNIWRDCLESNKWPAYPTQICYADPPAWALNQYLESMEQE